MSEGWAIDIFNFMVAIFCLCYSNVLKHPGFVTVKARVQSNQPLKNLTTWIYFLILKKTPDIAEDYILSKIASQNTIKKIYDF